MLDWIVLNQDKKKNSIFYREMSINYYWVILLDSNIKQIIYKKASFWPTQREKQQREAEGEE